MSIEVFGMQIPKQIKPTKAERALLIYRRTSKALFAYAPSIGFITNLKAEKFNEGVAVKVTCVILYADLEPSDENVWKLVEGLKKQSICLVCLPIPSEFFDELKPRGGDKDE